MLWIALPRRTTSCVVLLALRGQPHVDDVQQHADESQPHGHGDVLQGDPGRSRPVACATTHRRSIRLRAGDHGSACAIRRAYLRGSDQLLRADLRGGQKNRLEGRRRGVLAHYKVQSVLMNAWRLRLAAPLVAALALAASVAGIANQFTYDDRYIIE